ncbi:hypothetical protein ACAW74_25705 [Fibrella sp. WM1]|uniref:hypothetical protein n=1 Tax=Fibrella musci TaxID=3242485 RepID=UPI003521572B
MRKFWKSFDSSNLPLIIFSIVASAVMLYPDALILKRTMLLIEKAWDALEPKQISVIFFSLLASVLASRQDAGLGFGFWHRVSNIISGFAGASLVGMGLLETGCPQWLATGLSYLAGHCANRIINAVITAAKQAEGDPIDFAKRVIALVWFWKNPNS